MESSLIIVTVATIDQEPLVPAAIYLSNVRKSPSDRRAVELADKITQILIEQVMDKNHKKAKKAVPSDDKPRCGLCGKTKNLTKTECCDTWICDDEDKYVMFSYARNSCYRNHRRFTLCGYHHVEEHPGHWKDCQTCRDSFETEMYVWYGTNEYNFEKLENPPAFEPTLCSECGAVIVLSQDSYSTLGDKNWCEKCSDKRLRSKN